MIVQAVRKPKLFFIFDRASVGIVFDFSGLISVDFNGYKSTAEFPVSNRSSLRSIVSTICR